MTVKPHCLKCAEWIEFGADPEHVNRWHRDHPDWAITSEEQVAIDEYQGSES